MSEGVSIERLPRGDAALESALREFLSSRPDATVFQEPSWHDVIRTAYGHECDYWIAKSGREVRGAFPVTRVRHPLLGTKLVASAYQYGNGGPIAESPELELALIERAAREIDSTRAKHFEIRPRGALLELPSLGFLACDTQLVTTVTPLRQIAKANLRKGHWEEREYALRRGVTVRLAANLDEVRQFRRLYQQEGLAFGSPQAPWRFFEALCVKPEARSRVWLAHGADGELLGGLLTIEGGRTICARCVAQPSAEAVKLRVNKALFWRAMTDAAERGLEAFEFGISWTGQVDLIRFKEGWNGKSAPALLYVRAGKGAVPNPGSYFEGHQLAKQAWRRLPLGLADFLGGQVTRWIC